MRVEELRTELHQRGLTTTGTKPTLVTSNSNQTNPLSLFSSSLAIALHNKHLVVWCILQVRRLEAALRRETRHSTLDADASSSHRKRPRESNSNRSNRSNKTTTTRRGISNQQSLETISHDLHHVDECMYAPHFFIFFHYLSFILFYYYWTSNIVRIFWTFHLWLCLRGTRERESFRASLLYIVIAK